ncbi:hypothetical protein HQ545_00505 [Candidatus Woesearchaeota archaeon]|nr:hypothetical protein [Candidatus Woesearchaeota archaeon]
MKKPDRTNLIILGAAFLIVGLLVEFITVRVISTSWNVFYKTTIIMVLIVAGYSFAEAVLARTAQRSIKALQRPFINATGIFAGPILFYILLYSIIFVLYLIVFTYGMDFGRISANLIPIS